MNTNNRNGKKKPKKTEFDEISDYDDKFIQKNKRLNKTKRGNKNFED